MATPKQKIAIIGTGLIGASLGLALKRGGLKDAELVGYDENHGHARQAQKLGAIDRAENNLAHAVTDASLVIVAVPILASRDVFQAIAGCLTEGAVVTDTSSTKVDVMRWAAESLPEHVDFIGGHPMAGKETPGAAAAEADLFEGKPYILTPSAHASPAAIRSVTGLARVVGAEPLFMDAAEHDQYAAAVSHMPLMMSTALFTLMRGSPSWDDLGSMAGPAFRDMTRLASGDPSMAHGMWRTNREGIIHWLERMIAELGRYRDMLQDAQDEQLLQTFAETQIQRETFLAEPPSRKFVEPVTIDKQKALLDMLIGAKMADNLRRAEKLPELMRETRVTTDAAGGEKKKLSLAEKIGEGVRRDLEKLEAERAARENPDAGKK